MTKIKEIVKINSGYSSYVILRREYFNEEERRVRMERYKPITSHRLAFERISNAVNPKDKRFYFLTGSYGTGKSHLCLMLSNYFANQSGLPEMTAFFSNYEEAQKNVKKLPNQSLREVTGEQMNVSSLVAKRKDGRYLVALCDFSWNLDFEGAILRAIFEALDNENFTEHVDTYYNEALRKIDELKTKPYLFEQFHASMADQFPDWTQNKLIDRLKNFDEEALKVFKECFKEATTNDFVPQKANLQLIIEDIIKNEKFKKAFKGIAIIYDEFGYALDGKTVNLRKLHAFAEFCSKSGMESLPVVFIGTGHKSFADHGEVGDRVHYETIRARVEEVPLRTEGMEDIIGAIVQPLKESPGWVSEVKPNDQIFSTFPSDCKEVNIFYWLPAPVLKENIIVNIFPMHPMATYGLLELAKSIGSDNRSVFKFFSPEFATGEDIWESVQPYSYPWFTCNNEILNSNGRLNFLTVDLVLDYFIHDTDFDIDNKSIPQAVKSIYADYRKTYRELKRYIQRESGDLEFEEIDDLIEKILKVMLVHELITNDEVQITNNLKNIFFSLNAISTSEKGLIENRLKSLTKVGILYRNSEGDFYEFKRSDAIDVRRMVDDYKANPDNKPKNVVDIFKSKIWSEKIGEFLDAKDYNLKCNEDKRLKLELLSIAEVEKINVDESGSRGISSSFEKKRKSKPFGKDYYEGTAIIVYCDSDDQIDRAKHIAKLNKEVCVFYGIPKKPIDVSDEIFTYEAIKSIENSNEFANFSTFEKAEFNGLKESSENRLLGYVEKYSSNSELVWFEEDGTSVALTPNKFQDIANHCSVKIYEGIRNKVPHKEFNKAHQVISGGAVQRIWEEACNILGDISKPISIDHTWADNRGGIQYIKLLFVDKPILEKISSDGDIYNYQLRQNVSGFMQFFPGLAHLLEKIGNLEKGKPVRYKDFINPLFEEYGLGEIAVSIFLLLAKRYYGDSLTFKRDETSISDLHITSSEALLELIKNQHPNAIISVRDISDEDKNYFTVLYSIFSKDDIEAGKEYSLNEAYSSMLIWWNSIDIISKSDILQSEEYKPYTKAFNKMVTLGAYGFIKSELLKIFDILENEKITEPKLKKVKEGLKKFKEYVDDFLLEKKKSILKGINEIFGSQGETDEHLKDVIKEWSGSLDDKQKDRYSDFQTDNTKALLQGINDLSTISQFFLETLPEKFKYGTLKNWTIDHQVDYLAKISIAKNLIDKNKIKVPSPTIRYEGKTAYAGDKIEYYEKLDLHIIPANEDAYIYITDNNSDPRKEDSGRKMISSEEVIEIRGNKKLKIVSADKDGNYGYIQELKFIDKNEKVKISGEKDIVGDILIDQFIFPKNEAELRASLQSYLSLVLKEKIVSKEKLEELIKEILSK